MKFRKNLDVILYEKIRESFLRGEFKLGEKIGIDKLAEKYEVSMPIVEKVNQVLFEGKPAKDAVSELMMRDGRSEYSNLPWD